MCGILGSILGNTGSPDPGRFNLALGLLEHRGPDRRSFLVVNGSGTHRLFGSLDSTLEPAGGQIVLGFCRLAILDLSSAGDQPMTSPDGLLHIVFNGEIFNYLEIREELVQLGWRFRSQSDTEVLLAAYQQWGADCLGKLLGMFAFAVADMKRRVLFLARDHLGIKPLYYTFASGKGAFSFASQVAALLKVSSLPPVAQSGALGDYLLRGHIDHTQATLFRGVEQVLPGHYLEIGMDQTLPAAQVRYWSAPAGGRSELSASEATEQFRGHLEDSVRLHLRSDVPVASALSGGMDSSSIVSLMRKLQPPDTPIHTFTFVTRGCPGFDPAWDEEKWADIVGQSARAVMHKVRVDPHQLPQDCERFLLLQDGPFGSPVVWVQQKIFQAAHAAGFRAMMSGQGADELVAGYRRHIAARLASLLRQGRMGKYLRLLRAGNRQPNPEGLGLRSAS
ncbi:MAG TPA: asparagine synthase (glutamine-hydrolyzing), partial [Candidatus Acidoferrum sp.]|nr:asparagine synthase (glutamine-hydrolyzing) [Candidatus Acidoferrum sp.]